MVWHGSVQCTVGRALAFTFACLALWSGVTTGDFKRQDHLGLERTVKGVDQQGPLKGVAAPMAPEQSAYGIVRAADSFESFNEAQQMRVQYRKSGFDLHVTSDAGPSMASLTLLGIGRGEVEFVPGEPLAEVVEAGRLEVDHGAFQMVYEDAPRGMRHDLIVLEKPSGEGALEACMRITGDLLALQLGDDEVVFHSYDTRSMALAPVIRYSGLHAWDATGRTLRSKMELRDDQLVLAVQDADAIYPVTIDPISSTADLQVTGTQSGETFGFSVATAGDVNGDGYSDIIVGAPGWNTPLAAAGRAMIFLGSATGIDNSPAWTVQGTGLNARFGFSVSSAGDLNGDGISDVVVGAPGHNGHGAVFAYLGSPTGPSTVATAVWSGDSQAGSEFGRAVALAGDVNGDGYSDVIIGAPQFDAPPSGIDHGKAYCYHGNTLTLGWTAIGLVANIQFGFSVAGAGDLNGDGLSDVAVGAPYFKKLPSVNNGAFYVYQGNAVSGLSATAGSTPLGGGNANLGYSLSSAGDMNGDGYADLIIGAPGVGGNNGSAYVYLGTGVGTTLVVATSFSVAGGSGERLGESVGLAGDVNGDGYSDVIVGSPKHALDKGRVQVFRGGPTPALDAAHLYWTQVGNVAGDRLGAAVATAGDVNGDGISDLLVGAPDQGGKGVISIFHGAPDLLSASPNWSKLGTEASGYLGTSVASAGDVNGDGYSDVIIGGTGLAGRLGNAKLFLGSAAGLSATPAWSVNGEHVDDLYGHVVASAGDVNGDGYGDVLVGAPGWPNYTWRGKVYLYLGSPAGLSATPAWTGTGAVPDDRFGYGLSSAGDVNGDGFSDVLIGSYMYNSGQGKAQVFHGSAMGLPAVPNWTVLGSANSFFAASVSQAGDVNGDGYDDVIIGADLHDILGASNHGAAFVYHGSPAGLSSSPDWSAFGSHGGARFGNSVSYAGDVNGDGYSDVVIGEYYHDVGTNTEAGRAYVFHGSPFVGLLATANTIIDGVQLSAQSGVSVCSAGDVNGDGYSDVIIGAHRFSMFYLYQGSANVHLGSASGIGVAPAWSAYGNGTGSNFGFRVALAGDVNGDGYSDVIVGADKESAGASTGGGAFLFQGNGARSLSMPTFQYRGNLVTPVRTSNGTFDPGCDWGIGQYARSSMGRSKLKLAWQFVGHGPTIPTSPFNNNSTDITGEAGSWTDIGLPGVLLKQLLSAASSTTSHPAWRARLRFHPATALDGRTFGRWFAQGVHDLQVPSIKTELMGCGPLPVTLVQASVACVGGQALLEWATASEQDCAEFRVQRSSDGEVWETVGRLPCSGNSSSFLQYQFVDPNPDLTGITYYRLDQYDINGTRERYPVMVLTPCGRQSNLVGWPNPFREELHLDLSGIRGDDGPFTATIRDMSGRDVFERTLDVTNWPIGHVRNMAELLPGAYLIELRSSRSGVVGHVRAIRM